MVRGEGVKPKPVVEFVAVGTLDHQIESKAGWDTTVVEAEEEEGRKTTDIVVVTVVAAAEGD